MNHVFEIVTFAAMSPGLAISAYLLGLQAGIPQNETQRPHVAIRMADAENATAMFDAGKADAAVVTVTRDGAVFLGIDRFDPSGLTQRVRDLLANKTSKRAYIRADARAKFSDVEGAMNALSAAGADTLGLLVAKKNADPEQEYRGFEQNLTGLDVLVQPAFRNGHGSPSPIPQKDATILEIVSGQNGVAAYSIDRAGVGKSQLLSKLTIVYQSRVERVLFIKADGTLDFATVAEAIDLAREAGANDVVLLTPQLSAVH
jgi:biopolymer transport protein ExbD